MARIPSIQQEAKFKSSAANKIFCVHVAASTTGVLADWSTATKIAAGAWKKWSSVS